MNNKVEDLKRLLKEILEEEGPNETMRIWREIANTIPAGNNIHSKDFRVLKMDKSTVKRESKVEKDSGPIIPFF